MKNEEETRTYPTEDHRSSPKTSLFPFSLAIPDCNESVACPRDFISRLVSDFYEIYADYPARFLIGQINTSIEIMKKNENLLFSFSFSPKNR